MPAKHDRAVDAVPSSVSMATPKPVLRPSEGTPLLTAAAILVVGAAVLFSRVGLPNFSLMGPFYAVGLVMPSCGLTRAVTAIADGQFLLAWRFNPAGYLVTAAVASLLVRAIIGAATNRWIAFRLDNPRPLLAVLVVSYGALWVNQQLNAEFIMNTTLGT